MTFKEIITDYKKIHEQYRNKYEEHFIEVLSDIGLWNIDVKDKQSNKLGRFELMPRAFGFIEYELKFSPYNKQGKKTSKYNNVMVFPDWGEEQMKEKLLELFEIPK